MIAIGSERNINRIIRAYIDENYSHSCEYVQEKCFSYVKKNHLIGDNKYNLNYVAVTCDVYFKNYACNRRIKKHRKEKEINESKNYA